MDGLPTPPTHAVQGRDEWAAAVDVAGESLDGEIVTVRTVDVPHDTVLVFLSSGCAGCVGFWDELGTPGAWSLPAGARLVVVTKDAPDAGSTRWAQGGVAVVLGDIPNDSVDAHLTDTLAAGGGLVDADAAAEILAAGPAAVAGLRAEGAVFDGPAARLARTREGGHRAFRVVRAGGDATGAEVERALVAAARHRGLTLLTGHVALDAVHAADGSIGGVTLLDDAGRFGVLRAPAVLLAIRFDEVRERIDLIAGAPMRHGEQRTLYSLAFNRHEEEAIVSRLTQRERFDDSEPFVFRLPVAQTPGAVEH